MIVAIGNAPSSGSTLLADILDSLPFAVCGPEIGLFSFKAFYSDFDYAKNNLQSTCSIPKLTARRSSFRFKRLGAYGVEPALLNDLLKHEKDFAQFCYKLFEVFSTIRNKKSAILFEKTPNNIHFANDFLKTFEDGYFIHIVRDPFYVFGSLRRRGFPLGISIHNWMIDVSNIYKLSTHPRVFTISYEELVKNPFNYISNFLYSKFNIDIGSDKIEELYYGNQYRQLVSRKIKTWSVNKYGSIKNANIKDELNSENEKAKICMINSAISINYAKHFNLPAVSFLDLIEHFGYTNNKEDQNLFNNKNFVIFDKNSKKYMLKKALIDCYYKDCNLLTLNTYLRPVTYIIRDK